MMYSIYQIQNLTNLKTYIGYSKVVSKRWGTHKRKLRKGIHENKHLQSSWTKYGEEVFKFSVLIEGLTKESVLLHEKVLIKIWKDTGYSYNYMPGGDGGATMSGRHHSEETKRKISKANKGTKPSPQSIEAARKKLTGRSNSCKGKPLSVRHRWKLCQAKRLYYKKKGENQ